MSRQVSQQLMHKALISPSWVNTSTTSESRAHDKHAVELKNKLVMGAHAINFSNAPSLSLGDRRLNCYVNLSHYMNAVLTVCCYATPINGCHSAS